MIIMQSKSLTTESTLSINLLPIVFLLWFFFLTFLSILFVVTDLILCCWPQHRQDAHVTHTHTYTVMISAGGKMEIKINKCYSSDA